MALFKVTYVPGDDKKLCGTWWTTTTDPGDKHTLNDGATLWDDQGVAEENAQGCNGALLRVEIPLGAVRVTLEPGGDFRKQPPVDVDVDVVMCAHCDEICTARHVVVDGVRYCPTHGAIRLHEAKK